MDNLVNYKYGIARDEDIIFDTDVFLPAELPFRSGHLTIVFGNLLDNALGRVGKYVTTKKDRKGHGLGLSSVEQAVEAYCGQVEANGQDGVFRVSVVMYGNEGEK